MNKSISLQQLIKEAAAKKPSKGGLDIVKEETNPNGVVHSDDAFEILKSAGAKHLSTTSSGIVYYNPSTGFRETLTHDYLPTGHRVVSRQNLGNHLIQLHQTRDLIKIPGVLNKE